MLFRNLTQLCCVALGITAAAQHLWNAAPIRYEGVSNQCEAALNNEVACPLMLKSFTDLPELLELNQLEVLCTDDCMKSLQTSRKDTQEACTEPGDVMVEASTAYPATRLVDKYIQTVAKSCLRDVTTGEYCHTLFRAWSETDAWSEDRECSQCVLDLLRTNLELPLQYTPAAAQEYLDTGLRCGMELPSIEVPAAYALNATAKVPLADNKLKTPLSCDRPYIVGSGDTCRSIAESQQVSTLGLIQANNLDYSCAPLPPVGGTLCLPRKCRVYVVQKGDNCFDIVTKNGVKASLSLKAWNPVINKKCNNFADLVGTAICVSEPGLPLPNFEDTRTKQKLVQPDMNAPMGTRERRLAMELFAKDFRERILRDDQEVARAREQNEAPDAAE